MHLPEEPKNQKPFQGLVAHFYQTPQRLTEAFAWQINEAKLKKQKTVVLLPGGDQNGSGPIAHWLESNSYLTDRMPTMELVMGINNSPILMEFESWYSRRETESVQEGFSALCVWMEMTWAAQMPEIFDAHFAGLSNLHNRARAGASIILSYDQNHVDLHTSMRLLELHPRLLLNQQIIQNPIFQAQNPVPNSNNNGHFSTLLSWIENSAEQTNPRQETNSYPRAMIDLSPYGMLLCDSLGNILSMNPSAREILGYTQNDDVSNLLFSDIVGRLDCCEELQKFLDEKSAGNQDIVALECQLTTRSGALVPVEMKCRWYFDHTEANPHLLCYFTDISHHYEIEDALRISEQRYRFLVEYQGEGVVMIDTSGIISYINEAGAKLVESTPDNVIGQPVMFFIPETHKNILNEQLEKRRIGISSSYELTLKSAAGNLREVLVTATPRHNSDGVYNGTLAIFRDITERKQLEEKLRYQSSHDPMTGLYNRAHFDDILRQYDAGTSPHTSIIIVDVDGLKEVNDQDGHRAGDQLIRKVAHLLVSAFRTRDVIARIGGDEFAILLFETDENQLHQAILRLRRNLEEVNNNLPNQDQISFSIGGATTNPNRDINQTLIQADLRMYRQKRRKKAAHGSQLLDEFGAS